MTLLRPHGGYKQLLSYQTATIIYDLTIKFCDRYIIPPWVKSPRTYDQMVQAARSGKQNIGEASGDAATSAKIELKLLNIARSSLRELGDDCEDFLRQHDLPQWDKNDQRSLEIRQLGYKSDRSYKTYMSYLINPETAANCLLCLINQATYLLDRQIEAVVDDFEKNGGFTEKMYNYRKKK